MSDPAIYVNGSFVSANDPAISPLDRGYALGDGLFETMLVENGRVFRLGAHWRRLKEALARLDISLPHDEAEIEAIVGETLVRNGLRRAGSETGSVRDRFGASPEASSIGNGFGASVRLTVSRGVPAERGLLPGPLLSGPTIVIQATPFAGYPAEKYEKGFAAIVASIRRNETSPAASMKSCNYLDNILVRAAAAAVGADEGLMLNIAGKVACGSASNVFLVKDECLRTPPPSAGILAGIARAVVIEIAAREQINLAEDDITLDQLRAADEAFVTNSLMGVMPLTRLDSRPIGDGLPGRVTTRLRRLYDDLVRRETNHN